MQANLRIRTEAKNAGVRLWEIAEAIGITDGMLSKKLRRELPEVEQQNIIKVIFQISQRRE